MYVSIFLVFKLHEIRILDSYFRHLSSRNPWMTVDVDVH